MSVSSAVESVCVSKAFTIHPDILTDTLREVSTHFADIKPIIAGSPPNRLSATSAGTDDGGLYRIAGFLYRFYYWILKFYKV